MSETVIEYVLRRLKAVGVNDIFGVAGDFAFPVQDAIVHHAGIRWIGCCNELNAGYAADGYARVHGLAGLSTVCGPGELGAIGAVAGSYSAVLPVFHLVGMPAQSVQDARALVHHTLGNGEFDTFKRMADMVVAGSAIMTPQNVARETERLIAIALYQRRPVYLAFPADLVDRPIVGAAEPLPLPKSDPGALEAAVAAIVKTLGTAETCCVLPGLLAVQLGLRNELQALIDASGMPFASLVADKSTLDERQPAYVGIYNGRLLNEPVREFVESADQVVCIGTVMTDLNTGAFTSSLAPEHSIDIGMHRTRVGTRAFTGVEMAEVLARLTRELPKRNRASALGPTTLGEVVGKEQDPIGAEALYPRLERFFQPDDTIVVDTGTCSTGLYLAHLPRGARFHQQSFWAAIGWATPAALGAAVADPSRRLILITGEGAHQMTAQEISQFQRYGLKPIVFTLNNAGYLIERLLCREPDIAYNDLAAWNYAELPHALGCVDWYTARVTRCAELDAAMATAAHGDRAAYIEVVMDPASAPPMAERMHDNMATLYSA